MLLFVFIIAITNLGVGYALGTGLSFRSLLELLPKRKAKRPPADLADDEPLSQPAKKATKPPAAEAPQAVEATPPSQAPAKPKPADVMAGLAAFREKLATANVELNDNREDPDGFEATATKLQEVNHAYLEEAEGAIKHLEELGAAGDTVASATCDAVNEGASQVARISSEIDGLIEGGLTDDETRAHLINSSEKIQATAGELEETAGEAIKAAESAPPPPPAPTPPPATPEAAPEPEAESKADPETPEAPAEAAAEEAPEPADEVATPSFASVDEMFERLEKALSGEEPEATHHVAAIQIDPIDDSEEDPEKSASLTRAIEQLAGELLAENQALVHGTPVMVLLDGDSFDEATERVERIRQQVGATTFTGGDSKITATVTCAVADVHPGAERQAVLEQLTLALEESSRLGTNRTFHHDGAFPTPVPELPVETTAKTVALA